MTSHLLTAILCAVPIVAVGLLFVWALCRMAAWSGVMPSEVPDGNEEWL